MLNAVNYNSLVTTKAARIALAGKSSPIWEYGLRRAQGSEAALRAARGAWIGGCAGTSNVLAAKIYGIPLINTMSHSWVLAHESEAASFKSYIESSPQQQILVVDTYDIEDGVKKLIEVLDEMKLEEDKLPYAIRLDSGDLVENSKIVRKLLNKAGYRNIKIAASGDLDEYSVDDLKNRGARIDIYCIGTRLVTAFDEPALNGIYKMSAVRRLRMKSGSIKSKRLMTSPK